jgi:fibronectin-binding autotransporter adhesin
MSLGASTMGTGSLSLTSVGLTQTGAFVQDVGSAGAEFNANAGSIVLTNAGNAFRGSLSLYNSGAGTAQLVNSVATVLGFSTIGASYTVTSTGNITQSGQLGIGGTSSITANGGWIALTNASNSFGGAVTLTTTGANNYADVYSSGGLTLGTVNITGNLIAGTSGALTLSAANSFAVGRNVTLTATGASGAIAVNAAQTATGGGSFTLDASRNVAISANVTSGNGDILIKGNVSSWSGPYDTNAPVFGTTTGDFKGVDISGGADITSSGGNIAIAGKGGNGGAGPSPAGSNQFGVSAGASSTISTTGSGFIAIHGYGGPSPYDNPGSGGSHTGIYLNGAATGTAVDIATVNGQLKLVGTGNATGGGSGYNNGGVALLFAKARSTGSGSIDITGTAAAVGVGRGVYIGLAGSEVTGATGNVTITGTGGGTAASNYGFYSAGVEIGTAGIVRTTGAGSGTVTLIGTPGATGSGILFSGAAPVLGDSTMTGNLTLRTDNLSNTATGLSITHAASSGTVTFRPETDSTTIGVNGASGTLAISGGILGAVSGFGGIVFGSATQTGGVQIDSTTFARNVTIQTQGAGFTNALTMGGNDLTIIAHGGYSQGVGAITSTGIVTFSGVGNVTATNTGNSFGSLVLAKTGTAANVSVSTTSALSVGASTMGTGTIDLTGGAGLSQTGAFVQDASGVQVSLYGGTGNVAFTNSGNVFTGNVLATAVSGSVALTSSSGALTLHDITAGGAITISAGGALSQAAGTSILQTGAGTVSLSSSTGGVALRGITTVGDLTVSAGGGSVTQAGAGLNVGGNASFTSVGGNVALNGAANSATGTISLSASGGNVDWSQVGGTALFSSITAGGNLTIDVTGGSVSQVGAFDVTGTSSINASSATLLNPSNAFGGALSITVGAGMADIAANGNLDLGPVTAGMLSVSVTGGNLTQSGLISVSGLNTTLNVTGTTTLANGANNFGLFLDLLGAGGGALAGTVGGLSGALAIPNVTALSTGYTFGGTAVPVTSSTPPPGFDPFAGFPGDFQSFLATLLASITFDPTTGAASFGGDFGAGPGGGVAFSASGITAFLAEAPVGPGGFGGSGGAGGPGGFGPTSDPNNPNNVVIGGPGAPPPPGPGAAAPPAGTFAAAPVIILRTASGQAPVTAGTPAGGAGPQPILGRMLVAIPVPVPSASPGGGQPGVAGPVMLLGRF